MSKGKHTMPLRIYWVFIGLGIGIVMAASVGSQSKGDGIAALVSGILMGVGMAVMATKPGVDQ